MSSTDIARRAVSLQQLSVNVESMSLRQPPNRQKIAATIPRRTRQELRDLQSCWRLRQRCCTGRCNAQGASKTATMFNR